MSKRCLSCLELKDDSKFHFRKNKQGLQSYCKECASLKNKAYRAGPKREEILQKQRDSRNKNLALERKLYQSAKRRAVEKSIIFNLSLEDIKIPDECPVLKIPLFAGSGGIAGPNSPSIDRIKPEVGYTKDNIAIISMKANMMKSNSTIDEVEALLSWMKKVCK